MTEKKATVKSTTAKAAGAAKSSTSKTTTTKRCATKKAAIVVDAENAGFRAGDVYQALSAAGAAMSVAELAKATQKTDTEILLGIGWLLKEGKVKGEEGKITLA
ncbi:winged helix-turn-helix domain-containing protein [Hallella colorans]|uniref:Winged helix-turn-helix protein DUF2582 n=1 Tax=Hallella colorans TaxID=1703337 RepID=A0A2U0UNV6_9BACT|nr:winged helix-turn-helix domain-containing protein [Hallella colorans]PVX59322.1 winged helix-turn-helix protein DUF2582 [Hallella colorans]